VQICMNQPVPAYRDIDFSILLLFIFISFLIFIKI
jgi:hypothetical protein